MEEKTFAFQSHKLPLDIAGEHFAVDVSMGSGIFEKLKDYGRDMLAYSKTMYTGEDPEQRQRALDEAVSFLMSRIDLLLEEGASARIFSGRERNYDDCLDVLRFITESVCSYRSEATQSQPVPTAPSAR